MRPSCFGLELASASFSTPGAPCLPLACLPTAAPDAAPDAAPAPQIYQSTTKLPRYISALEMHVALNVSPTEGQPAAAPPDGVGSGGALTTALQTLNAQLELLADVVRLSAPNPQPRATFRLRLCVFGFGSAPKPPIWQRSWACTTARSRVSRQGSPRVSWPKPIPQAAHR